MGQLADHALNPPVFIHAQYSFYHADQYLKYYNVAKPVAVARAMLERVGVYNRTADRLAVMLLYSHEIGHEAYGKKPLHSPRRARLSRLTMSIFPPGAVRSCSPMLS